MSVDKVCIYPCGGIGLIVSCVTRLAGYIVVEDLVPGKTELLDVLQVLRGVPEKVELAENYPTIVLDGCAHQCGSNFLHVIGVSPAARIYINDVIWQTKLAPGRVRQELEECGQQLGRETARLAAEIGKSLLNDSTYHFQPQPLARGMRNICDDTLDAEAAHDYIEVAPAIYRPAGMPPLPLEFG